VFGAAWGHVQQIIVEGNYASYNFFPAITDTLIPIWLLGLLYAYWRAGGLESSYAAKGGNGFARQRRVPARCSRRAAPSTSPTRCCSTMPAC
jgi:hypothetical protein